MMDVRESYDSAAEAYTEHLASELAQKPLDRHLLNRFAEATRGRGLVADVGCGPGHVARYLHDQGVAIVGIDLSPEMIRCAARLHPGLEFMVGDMRELSLPDASLFGRCGVSEPMEGAGNRDTRSRRDLGNRRRGIGSWPRPRP
jgi:SAM-dependent methyltransferase